MAVEITVDYEGTLRCRATHGPSKNQLVTDAPADNMGKGEAFSPTDLVATALATCILTTIGIVAQRKNLEIKSMRAHIEKHMSTDAPRRIVRLPTKVWISLPPDHPERLCQVVGYCAQFDAFPKGITGYQFIYSFLLMFGFAPAECHERTVAALFG